MDCRGVDRWRAACGGGAENLGLLCPPPGSLGVEAARRRLGDYAGGLGHIQVHLFLIWETNHKPKRAFSSTPSGTPQ
jgi:hypothetical protein